MIGSPVPVHKWPFYPHSLLLSKLILAGKRPEEGSDIKHMLPKGNSCRAPEVTFIPRLDLEQKISPMNRHPPARSWTTLTSSLCLSLLIFCFFLTATAEATKSTPATQKPYVIKGKRYYPIPSSDGFRQRGFASWYGKDFHGRMTSNGETYDMYSMTAAHKTLPMNTMLLVKNKENGKKLVVRVNDRGPFVNGRVIDLSYKAASQLGVVKNGTAKVELVALAEGTKNKRGGPPILVYTDMSAGEFYVQIGAFAQKINAIRLQKRFTDAGHTTIIQKYFGPKKVLYRVQVYAGKTLTKAQQAEKALHDHGYAGSFIIAR